MVKVFKYHHFKSQSIISTSGEPVDIFSYGNLVFVATENCTVEVFKLKCSPPHENISVFNTEAPIQKILYNRTGKYITTIECKLSRRQFFYSVKVYLYWEHMTESSKQCAHIRQAGKDRKLKPSEIKHQTFQVIDVPCKQKVQSVATCQQNGNLVIQQKDTTRIYYLVEKCIANSETTYLDIVLFLELQWSFDIENISICEDYIAAVSKEEAQVIKILYFDASKHSGDSDVKHPYELYNYGNRTVGEGLQRMIRKKLSSVNSNQSPNFEKTQNQTPTQSHSRVSHLSSSRASSNASPSLSSSSLSKIGYDEYSVIKDDAYFTQWNFEEEGQGQDFDVWSIPSLKSGSHGNKMFQKTVLLKGLQEISNRDLILADNPKIREKGAGVEDSGEIQVTTMLYKRQNLTGDEWNFVQLVPTYYSSICHVMPKLVTEMPMQSASYSGLVGLSCIISGISTGYNYDMWRQIHLLSQYKYTLAAQQIDCDGDLLYILNKKGLEIFTCRSHAAVIHRIENINGIDKAFPDVTMEPCLCGVHPFIGGQQMALSSNHVTLLTKVDASQKHDCLWTLYSLEQSTKKDLYRDMVAFGNKHHKSSSTTYLHMLQEVHMMLKSALIGQDCNQSDLKDLFAESCSLLGEYYAMPGSIDHKLCLPYYLMSELPVMDVVKKSLQYKQQSKQTVPYCYGNGFLHFLNHSLFLDEDPLNLEENEGDEILQIYSEAHPEKLSEVILFSRVKSYSTEKSLKLLEDVMRHTSDANDRQRTCDLLALACLHLQLCDPEPAQVALNAIPQHELTQICCKNHQLLHEEFTQLSPLSQLMRCHCANVLIQSLVILHDIGIIPLDLALKLLQGSNESERLSTNPHVKDYLELLLQDPQRKYIFDEAVTLLVNIYVERLQDIKYPITRQRQSIQSIGSKALGHFAERYSWLNYLPPFTGPSCLKQPCVYTITSSLVSNRRGRMKEAEVTAKELITVVKEQKECNCQFCMEDLIKLQSLLCSPYCRTNLVNIVLKKIQEQGPFKGSDSLQILCCLKKEDSNSVYELILDKYPPKVLKKKEIIHMLQEYIIGNPATEHQTTSQQSEDFQRVLLYLAEEPHDADFMSVLPKYGDVSFFEKYLHSCNEKEKLKIILGRIINAGKGLME